MKFGKLFNLLWRFPYQECVNISEHSCINSCTTLTPTFIYLLPVLLTLHAVGDGAECRLPSGILSEQSERILAWPCCTCSPSRESWRRGEGNWHAGNLASAVFADNHACDRQPIFIAPSQYSISIRCLRLKSLRPPVSWPCSCSRWSTPWTSTWTTRRQPWTHYSYSNSNVPLHKPPDQSLKLKLSQTFQPSKRKSFKNNEFQVFSLKCCLF